MRKRSQHEQPVASHENTYIYIYIAQAQGAHTDYRQKKKSGPEKVFFSIFNFHHLKTKKESLI